jgi:hypothetical protein
VDWEVEIVKGVLIHQRIEELDRGRLWRRHLPSVGANEAEISAAETQLGVRFDPKYRAFLHYADGWKSFYQAVDLFGTRNLLGAAPMDSAQRQLAAIDPTKFQLATASATTAFVPIAASPVQEDIFLLGQPWSSNPGMVLWFATREVERFPNFEEFFLAMLDYNRLEIAELEREPK